VIKAIEFMQENEHRRGKYLPVEIDLSFINESWRKLVVTEHRGQSVLSRRQLEICLFSYLADDFKSGDACVAGSENFSDFREQLLSWEACQPLLDQYCQELGFPNTGESFVEELKKQLIQVSKEVDLSSKDGSQFTIHPDSKPILHRLTPEPPTASAKRLKSVVSERLTERSILDSLANVEHWLHLTRHFGPLSGSEPKLSNPVERYLFTIFGFGCNLGPNETARHTRGKVTPHMLSYVHRRHFSTERLELAIRDVINAYDRFKLPKCWGTGKLAAADGSQFQIYDNTLISEYHIRYGRYGGIAYHHVSDTYIALFTHFISCGVWEAVYILDGLLKNLSNIQPDTLHADTQGQSTPVFAIAHLLGIELMPRIRNWQDLSFVRPSEDIVYEYIDPLFKKVVDWELIQTHWQDLMRVILSIRAGKLMPSTILRKLGSYSRRNRLYQVFEALGQVIRTLYLLKYLSDPALRRQVTDCTNKVEAYHQFVDWIFFGKEGIITESDPIEQEKLLKYMELVSATLILQNTVDMSIVIQELHAEGYQIKPEDLKRLSPYMTTHLKRYGDFVLDLSDIPQPLDLAFLIPFEIPELVTV
jgi:TnpA family transposase